MSVSACTHLLQEPFIKNLVLQYMHAYYVQAEGAEILVPTVNVVDSSLRSGKISEKMEGSVQRAHKVNYTMLRAGI